MLSEIMEMDKKYYMNTFGTRLPAVFTHGEGINLYTHDGREFRDFFAGIAVNLLGHAHKDFVAALREQAGKLLHTSNLYYTEPQTRLAKMLCESSCADKVFFANSGAEANEGAIKLAKIYFYKKGQAHKNEIITLVNSFHGRTLATVAATGQPKYQKPYKPLTPGFVHVPINDSDALQNAITPNTAAIMLEMIQGESGVHPCDAEYVMTLRKWCDEKEILLIADEVQTGIARTGKMFGYEHYGITPDIFTLAKALGGGIPIGAICAKDAVAAAFEPGDHGSTFGGNPFSCAAGLAVLDIVGRERLVGHAAQMGDYFKNKLNGLKERFPVITEVRCIGLMIGVDFGGGFASGIQSELFKAGILTGRVGDTLRILPPLIIKEADIDAFTDTLVKVVEMQ